MTADRFDGLDTSVLDHHEIEGRLRTVIDDPAPVAGATVEYEYVDDETERVSPADAAMQDDSPAEDDAPAAPDEPDWRADAEAALNDRDA